ncbi:MULTISPECIES: TetR/AcrR family transcriptional regulator [Methylorubrum]|uniref:TetR/AcrR family transcriptional regulator n=1 Tax=Methylorubrum TaxID=2282523 RepID=UPI00209F275B|nr:AcrR family transcriptional regulator [Methylorubrum zatmanii]MCP1556285.1 AcrR family transcriptional regulator [Methylorubrum extorquens]MCP1577402.1 AcrR family transcriptional regulator [Methylorubrum extorquens]
MSTSKGEPNATKGGYHHGDLREALVAAGLSILEEGGDLASLGLRETARRAGVSAMAPYRHFPDKDALLAAVAIVGFERLRAALEEADRGGEGAGREALYAQGAAYVAFASAQPGLFRLMFGGMRSGGSRPQALCEASAAAYAVLAERVAALVPGANAADEALRSWALVHGIASLVIDGLLGDAVRTDPQAAAFLVGRLLRLEAIPG